MSNKVVTQVYERVYATAEDSVFVFLPNDGLYALMYTSKYWQYCRSLRNGTLICISHYVLGNVVQLKRDVNRFFFSFSGKIPRIPVMVTRILFLTVAYLIASAISWQWCMSGVLSNVTPKYCSNFISKKGAVPLHTLQARQEIRSVLFGMYKRLSPQLYVRSL